MLVPEVMYDGASYHSRHLSANDYYSKDEKVIGHWQGQAAKRLGLDRQEITEETFERMRQGQDPISVYLRGNRLRLRLDSASCLAMFGQSTSVFAMPFAGNIAAQTSRNMYSISRHLLRRGIQFVSPGGKLFRSPDHALDEQTGEQLPVQPGTATFRVFFGKVSEPHN